MAVEKHDGGGVTITGYHIDIFRIKAIESALALEINTGMKMSHGASPMKMAARICGSVKRTKLGVLRDLVAWCELQVPQYRPMPSTVKALAK